MNEQLRGKFLIGEEETEAKYWMDKAGKIAERALCLRARCGSVIVREDVCIGMGYNAPPLDDDTHKKCLDEYDFSGKPKYDHTCCMHAEWRAILDALQNHPDKIKGSRLYFTRVDEKGNILRSGKPFCTVCSRLALDTGIAEFVLWHEEGICVYDTVTYNTLSYRYRETNT